MINTSARVHLRVEIKIQGKEKQSKPNMQVSRNKIEKLVLKNRHIEAFCMQIIAESSTAIWGHLSKNSTSKLPIFYYLMDICDYC